LFRVRQDCHVAAYLFEVEDPGEAQRAPEGVSSLGQCEAGRVGVDVCTSARPSTARIRDDVHRDTTRLRMLLNRDDPQQLGG
jgi:hypothetical protein